MYSRDLFLSRDFHCQIAIIIVKAVYMYAEENLTAGSTAIISQGMRQVNIVRVVIDILLSRSANPKPWG